jgi:topoisomerase IA-like protein
MTHRIALPVCFVHKWRRNSSIENSDSGHRKNPFARLCESLESNARYGSEPESGEEPRKQWALIERRKTDMKAPAKKPAASAKKPAAKAAPAKKAAAKKKK